MKKLFFGYLLFAFALVNCSQDEEKTKETNKNQNYEKPDFTQTDLNVGSSSNPILYSLQENKVIDYESKFTDQWDIEFIESNKSITIRPNNSEVESSSGNGGIGRAQIYLYEDEEIENQYFSFIEDVPKRVPKRKLFNQIFTKLQSPPSKFLNAETKAGISIHQANEHRGWYHYDFAGELLLSDDTPTKKPHVVYAFPRIIIVKTAKEEAKWAKLIITSRYKGNLEYPTAEDQVNFISFGYSFFDN